MSQYGWQNIEKGLFVNLFAVRLRSSPQTVSDDVVCLRKFYLLLHNMLIINTDKFLQRGGVLECFKHGSHFIESLPISRIGGDSICSGYGVRPTRHKRT